MTPYAGNGSANFVIESGAVYGSGRSLNLSSSCFVPSGLAANGSGVAKKHTTVVATSGPFSNFGTAPEKTSSDDGCSKQAGKATTRQRTNNLTNAARKNTGGGGETREKYHAGSSKWGKYKKREQEAKKKRNANQENIATRSEGGRSATSSGALNLSCDSKVNGQGDTTDTTFQTSMMKENFDFPDGGWVCSQC